MCAGEGDGHDLHDQNIRLEHRSLPDLVPSALAAPDRYERAGESCEASDDAAQYADERVDDGAQAQEAP
jgi:hypothetical protein